MFSAQGLFDAAQKRYGVHNLRERIRGAAVTEDEAARDFADAELRKIANSVLNLVEASIRAAYAWPLEGTWLAGSVDENGTSITGQAYADVWPPELLQRALEMFNWRTQADLAKVSDHALRIGQMAEKYFKDLAAGLIVLPIGTAKAVPLADPAAARARDGSALIPGVGNTTNVLEALEGVGWERTA